MKSITMLLIGGFMALSAVATASKVTIIFKSINKNTSNYQASVDGNSFYSNTNTKNSASYRITLDDLSIGSHVLKVYKLKNNSTAYNGRTANTLVYTKTFQLRDGYDMNITIQSNGKVVFGEQAVSTTNTTASASTGQMNNANFNTLLQNVRNSRSQSLKADVIHNAFANSNNHFSSYQIRQLLTMITSESDRLDLAKLSYANVTDSQNFGSIADLFNSTSYRNEFNNYMAINGGQTVGITGQRMADVQFNQLLQNVRNQWSQSLKGQAIHDAFVNTNNFFSTAQVRSLVGLISSESDRLELVKLAYRGVTDQANFNSLADLFTTGSYRNEIYSYNGTNTTPAQSTVAGPISDYSFNTLVQHVTGQWSQSLRIQAVRDAFANSNTYFSTSQIRQLLNLVSSESDRLQLVKLPYGTVTDRANYNSLADLFMSTAYRTEFNNYLYAQGGTSTPTNSSVRTPMANTEFSMLVLSVRSNLVQPLKVNAIQNIFNNPDYSFTSSQVKQLLSLINSETSRLDLAKMAYRSVTDRPNFNQLNDLFTTQSNRDNLTAYVQSYRD